MEGDRLLAELRKVLSYNPQTGDFLWLVRRHAHGRMIEIGDKAGTPKDGYVKITYTDSEDVRHQMRAHRLAWWFVTGVLPKEIDHWDRNRAHNAWANLREATRTQNNHNGGLRPDNVSGKKGVSWVARDGKWLARITVEGQHVDERFDDLAAAIACRKAMELKYMGRLSPS